MEALTFLTKTDGLIFLLSVIRNEDKLNPDELELWLVE